jgi:hypothetical protein
MDRKGILGVWDARQMVRRQLLLLALLGIGLF